MREEFVDWFTIKVVFDIFSKGGLDEYCQKSIEDIKSEIERMEESYVLNISETECIDYLVNTHTINCPLLDFENATISHHETNVRTDPKLVITYNLPLMGDYRFLEYQPPSSSAEWTYEVYALKNNGNNSMRFIEDAVETQERDVNELDKPYIFIEVETTKEKNTLSTGDIQKIFRNVKNIAKHHVRFIEKHNNQIKVLTAKFFSARKQRVIKNYRILETIGIPLHKRENLPETYTIPDATLRKKVTLKPIAAEKAYVPEPTLDQTTYYDILQTIHDVGKVFERLPSTYSKRSEQDLRDLLLLYLEPRYEGSATGETFNSGGRADILIRYENHNVFIAECKFWNGSEGLLETITQLLRYVIWRDSKIAVLMFVKNRNISSVLQKAKEVISSHTNYVGFVNEEDQSWFNYHFHINGDPNRAVKLALLLFHVPPLQDQALQSGNVEA